MHLSLSYEDYDIETLNFRFARFVKKNGYYYKVIIATVFYCFFKRSTPTEFSGIVKVKDDCTVPRDSVLGVIASV